jgi:hypothetical protein
MKGQGFGGRVAAMLPENALPVAAGASRSVSFGDIDIILPHLEHYQAIPKSISP